MTGFASYFEAEIAPHLTAFEAQRKRAWGKAPWLIIPFGTALFGWLSQNDIALYAGGAVGVIAAVFLWSEMSSAKGKQTSLVASKVCRFFGLTYNPRRQADLIPWFRELKLLPSYDRSHVDDYIEGEVEGTTLALSEIKLEERRTRRDSKGRRRTYYVTVFQGLLFAGTFAKQFSSQTVIRADKWVFNALSGLGQDGKRARLEDPEFERQFEVYTTDQVECRYLLTPTFMERLVSVNNKHSGGVEAAFDSNKFLLAISSNHKWFEADGKTSSLADPSAVVDMVEDVSILFDLVEDLNLSATTKV